MPTPHPLFATSLAAYFGACLGSFLNVCLFRLPRGEDVIYTPSRCPQCHNAIPACFNLPFIGWLALRGKCYHCHAPIAVRYLSAEALGAILFLCLWFASHNPILVLTTGIGTACLATATLILTHTKNLPQNLAAIGVIIAVFPLLSHPVAYLPIFAILAFACTRNNPRTFLLASCLALAFQSTPAYFMATWGIIFLSYKGYANKCYRNLWKLSTLTTNNESHKELWQLSMLTTAVALLGITELDNRVGTPFIVIVLIFLRSTSSEEEKILCSTKD